MTHIGNSAHLPDEKNARSVIDIFTVNYRFATLNFFFTQFECVISL